MAENSPATAMTTTPQPSVLDEQLLTIAPLPWTGPHATTPTYLHKGQSFNMDSLPGFGKLFFSNIKYIYQPHVQLGGGLFGVFQIPIPYQQPRSKENRCNGCKESRPRVICGRYGCIKEFRSKRKLAKHRSETCKAPQGWFRAKL